MYIKPVLTDYFHRTGEAVAMQSHIRLDENKKLKKGESVIRVRSLTVKTLAKIFHIPHRFGILSIDAEGVGDKVRLMYTEQLRFVLLRKNLFLFHLNWPKQRISYSNTIYNERSSADS